MPSTPPAPVTVREPPFTVTALDDVELFGQVIQVVGVRIEPVRGCGRVANGASDIGGAHADALRSAQIPGVGSDGL